MTQRRRGVALLVPTRREAAGAALVAAILAAGLLTSPERALAALAGLGDRPAAFVGLLVGVYLLRPFVAWPTMAVSVLVGYVLGPVAGLPVALVGAALTGLPPFYLAERFRDAGELSGRLGDGGRAYFRRAGDLRGVVAAKLAPLPADAVSATAGLAGVRTRAFVAGTLVGELPWTVAAVVVGGSARTATTEGLGGLGPPLLVGTTLAALLLLAGPAYRTLAGRTATGG